MSGGNYIELFLKSDEDKNNENKFKLSDILNQSHQVSIVLGSPGSGKTTLLQRYQTINSKEVKFFAIKEFLKSNFSLKENETVLLLDGIDEYQIISSEDPECVLIYIGNKINEMLKDKISLKIVLTCREVDWFGEGYDRNKLQEYIGQKVRVFYLQALNKEQQDKMADLLKVQDKENFLQAFQGENFLTNPQLFYMLSEIWKDSKKAITSKKALYEIFIENTTKEKNKNHKKKHFLEPEKKLKLAGYLSYFYFFCGIEDFNEEKLEELCDKEHGYPHDELIAVTKTNLFNENRFSHKTIVEFILARHIVDFKIKESHVSFERIKALFIGRNNRISPRLRGVYAWICSLSESKELLSLDPYYQAIHGDNSLFDDKLKEYVLLAIKKYSQTNPYFMDFSHQINVDGFYAESMDEFLQSEYLDAIKFENHYVYFLNRIITQANALSSRMEDFIKQKIQSNDIPYSYKEELIVYFGKKCSGVGKNFLKEILDSIMDGKIQDPENSLKDILLTYLYPNIITPQEIVLYLVGYEDTDIHYMYYLYLFKTPFEEKQNLIDKIFNNKGNFINKKHPYLSFPYYIQRFINDFLLEAYLEYGIGKVEELHNCLFYFQTKRYYCHYGIKIQAFGRKREEEERASQDKLQQISNRLFKIRVNKNLESNSLIYIQNSTFFYYCEPTNKKQVFLSALNRCKLPKNPWEFFKMWMGCLSIDEQKSDCCRKVAERYNLIKEYESYLYECEKEQKRRKEEESKRQYEWQQKNEEELKRNEEFFAQKSLEDIISNFNILRWIVDTYLFFPHRIGAVISENTFEKKGKEALREIIRKPIYKESLSVEKLAEQPDRIIDFVYYIAICVSEKDLRCESNHLYMGECKIDQDVAEYLYMIALHNINIANVPQTDLCSKLEQDAKSIVSSAFIKYLNYVFEKYVEKNIIDIFNKYFSKFESIPNLKILAQSTCYRDDIPNQLIYHLFRFIGFEMFVDNLDMLYKTDELNQSNKGIIKALIDFNNYDEKNGSKSSIQNAVAIYSIIEEFPSVCNNFQHQDSSVKCKVICYVMSAFDAEELMREPIAGSVMSMRDKCVHFLKHQILNILVDDELKYILESADGIGDYWKKAILNKKADLEEKREAAYSESKHIKEIKEMIFNNIPINPEMFFEEIHLRLQSMKQRIEDNENNNKLTYRNTNDMTSKNEEEIRDIIIDRLQELYKDTIWIREEFVANNRADMSAKFKGKEHYTVRIECKKDNNRDIIKGITEQLIDKYLNQSSLFGIYLVFYFGDRKCTKEDLIEKLQYQIRDNYKNKIKIMLIDFQIPNKNCKDNEKSN